MWKTLRESMKRDDGVLKGILVTGEGIVCYIKKMVGRGRGIIEGT